MHWSNEAESHELVVHPDTSAADVFTLLWRWGLGEDAARRVALDLTRIANLSGTEAFYYLASPEQYANAL